MNTDAETLITELRALGELERYPLPKDWYKKYSIPYPKALSIDEFLTLNTKTQFLPSTEEFEIRKIADGGIRVISDSIDSSALISVETKPIDFIKTLLHPTITDYIDTGSKTTFKSIIQ